MNETSDSMCLECADNNPKVITRIIHFATKSYLVNICNDCRTKIEFQGEELPTSHCKKENLE